MWGPSLTWPSLLRWGPLVNVAVVEVGIDAGSSTWCGRLLVNLARWVDVAWLMWHVVVVLALIDVACLLESSIHSLFTFSFYLFSSLSFLVLAYICSLVDTSRSFNNNLVLFFLLCVRAFKLLLQCSHMRV